MPLQVDITAFCLLTNSSTKCFFVALRRLEESFHKIIRTVTEVRSGFQAPLARHTITADFWNAPKRFPAPIEFDPLNSMHAEFIEATACLFAEAFSQDIRGLDLAVSQHARAFTCALF